MGSWINRDAEGWSCALLCEESHVDLFISLCVALQGREVRAGGPETSMHGNGG